MTGHDDPTPEAAGAPGSGPGLGAAPVDPAQESLSQALRAGFNVLRAIMVVLLVAYFLSGLFQVDPGERGLIVRFGKLLINDDPASDFAGTPVFGEGLHLSLPDPFDEKVRIPGRNFKPKIYTFSFPLEDKDRGRELSDIDLGQAVPQREKLKPGTDGTMLSGDRNLSHGLWAIEYRIDDAGRFVQNVGESPEAFEKLLRPLAENAIVRTVAGLPVERIIRTQTDAAGGDFTLGVKRRLSEELKRLETGVTIINVEAKTIEPGRVREAFVAVNSARSDRDKSEREAEKERQRILSETAGPQEKYQPLLAAIEEYGAAQAAGADEARLAGLRQAIDSRLEQAEGLVAARLREAQSRANEIRERVQQEYRLFVDYRNMYRRFPALTATRLWVRMREAVLGSPDNEVFFVPAAGEIQIITNRDEERRVQREMEQYKSRYKPEKK